VPTDSVGDGNGLQ